MGEVISEDTLNVETALKIEDFSATSLPITDVGKTQICYNTDSSKLAYIKTNDGLTNIVTNLDIFGSDFNFVDDAPEINTTNRTLTLASSLTVNSIPAGSYRIGFQYNWYITSTAFDFIAEVNIDNITVIHRQVERIASSAFDQFQEVNGFYITNLSSGNHTINLNYYGTGGRAYIGERHIEFFRVL